MLRCEQGQPLLPTAVGHSLEVWEGCGNTVMAWCDAETALRGLELPLESIGVPAATVVDQWGAPRPADIPGWHSPITAGFLHPSGVHTKWADPWGLVLGAVMGLNPAIE